MEALCKRVGVPMCRLYTIRHHVLTRLALAGATLQEVQHFARHKQVATTDRYLRRLLGETSKVAALLSLRLTSRNSSVTLLSRRGQDTLNFLAMYSWYSFPYWTFRIHS